jgi:SAM-dependent methyltransferase
MPDQTEASLAHISPLPFPPLELANRVGCLEAARDPFAFYHDLGQRSRADLEATLPAHWSFENKRVLDFGCGAGRTLRHFTAEAERGEFWGCDIDAASIAWMEGHLVPPFHVFRNDALPPLERPDGYFDLIWCVSVFTHVTDSWSAWLLELRRVLAPGGLLIATYMGEGLSETIAGEPWDERVIGMNPRRLGQSWDAGGPMVLHSPWWIREHWGRAFDVLELTPYGFATDGPQGQGVVVLRKTDAPVTTTDLERVVPSDEREIRALQQNERTLTSEILELRTTVDYLTGQHAILAEAHRAVTGSLSWRMTEPVRKLKRLGRSLVGRLRSH